MQWYLEALRKYAVFSGRARRREFWMFTLVNFLISIVLSILDNVLNTDWSNGYGLLGAIYALALIIPTIAVGVRRLHDTGRTGWWILIGLIPCVGFIVLLIFYLQDGPRSTNEYGPDPKAIGVA